MNQSQFIHEVTAENYTTVVLEGSHTVPVVVDFWAEWCQPCKMLMPILAKLVEEYQGKFILAKINTETQQEIAAQFGIRSIPTVKLFKDGQPADEFMGALPEQQIRAFLDKHIARESDKLLSRADQQIQRGEVDAAMALIEEARTTDPDNPRALFAYAQVKAVQGEINQAEAALDTLSADEQEKPEVVALRARFQFDRVIENAPTMESLESSVREDSADSEAIYQLAAHRVLMSDYEGALQLLLRLMTQDREYADDAGRKGMLAVFGILGGTGEIVKRYRSRMFNLLH